LGDEHTWPTLADPQETEATSPGLDGSQDGESEDEDDTGVNWSEDDEENDDVDLEDMDNADMINVAGFGSL